MDCHLVNTVNKQFTALTKTEYIIPVEIEGLVSSDKQLGPSSIHKETLSDIFCFGNGALGEPRKTRKTRSPPPKKKLQAKPQSLPGGKWKAKSTEPCNHLPEIRTVSETLDEPGDGSVWDETQLAQLDFRKEQDGRSELAICF